MIYEYLLFNLFVISGPLLVFFWQKPGIVKPVAKPLLLSLALAALGFAFYDQLVVNYFWFFNPRYITGIFLFSLPLEEVLFFITVPFACLLLWVNYRKYLSEKIFPKFPIYLLIITLIPAPFLLLSGKIYSGSVLLVFGGVVLIDVLLKTKLFSSRIFIIFIFLITNVLTFIFNLYLTARPIVIYNTLVKTNINIITIPLEDFVFGMGLIALTLIIYEKMRIGYLYYGRINSLR